MAAIGMGAEPFMARQNISAAMVALFGDTPTINGGAIMIVVAVASATTSIFGITTLIAVIIVGSVALAAMAFPTMMTMGTTLEDAIGCIAGRSPPAAPIGGTDITPA